MPVHDHDHCEDDEDEDDEADMEGEGLTKGDLKAMLLQGGQQRALAEAYMEQFGGRCRQPLFAYVAQSRSAVRVA